MGAGRCRIDVVAHALRERMRAQNRAISSESAEIAGEVVLDRDVLEFRYRQQHEELRPRGSIMAWLAGDARAGRLRQLSACRPAKTVGRR